MAQPPYTLTVPSDGLATALEVCVRGINTVMVGRHE